MKIDEFTYLRVGGINLGLNLSRKGAACFKRNSDSDGNQDTRT